MPISSAQLKPIIVKRSNLRRSRLSTRSTSASAFGSRHSTLQPQVTNEKFQQVIRQDQQNSAFRVFHGTSLASVNQPNHLRYIGAKTCIYASRKTTEAGVRRLPSANHHGIQDYSRRLTLDATETDDEAVSLIRYLQALLKCGSFSMRSKLSAFIVPICSSHGRPFWSLKINLLDANKQPTQTNFQLAAKQQIPTSNRRLKLKSRPNDEMQKQVDSTFSPFQFLFLIVKTAKKSLKPFGGSPTGTSNQLLRCY